MTLVGFSECSNGSSSKAANDEETGGVPSGYVEDFVEPRTKLKGIFSIPKDINDWYGSLRERRLKSVIQQGRSE